MVTRNEKENPSESSPLLFAKEEIRKGVSIYDK